MAYITLKRSAFFHNLDIIAQHCGHKDKIALVLKDNAYGHGLIEMATLAQEYGIMQAVVRNVEEARRVAPFFQTILILADTHSSGNEAFHYSINALEQITQFAQGTKVELKVNSGMHRNGIDASQLHEAFEGIAKQGLQLQGVFTHHRSADALSSEWFWQKKNFEQIKTQSQALQKHYGMQPLRFHSNNSAALFRESNFDDEAIVRVGIAAYGCLKLDATFKQPPLLPVLSLYARKIASRHLHVNSRVGYNGTYCAPEESEVSTYDIGYADGLMRAAATHFITPEGKAILGRISMDNATFSTTKEELLIFDDAGSLAQACSTISYEVLTSLKAHLKRQIV
jgi:alanine racemase